MSKRLAAVALVLTGLVVVAPTAAHAEPVCPQGYQSVHLTVPGTGIRRFVACVPDWVE